MLESNPRYDIARRQMKGGSGMLSFDVKGGLEAGKRFINSLKLCTLAVSLGDTETLVEQAAPYGPPHPHPCRFPLLTITAADPPAVPEGLLRLDRKRSRTMITCVIRNVCY
jgi:hypothetical protein